MYPLKLLMYVTFAEAISWLGLLAGMILKYGFDDERGVSVMGPIHGFLFIAFCFALLVTHMQERWSIQRTVVSFLEAVPPFLGFLLGARLLEEVRERDALTSAVE